jgi:hypothetical protein
MNRFLIGALALALGSLSASAQSLEDLNIQIHGYATQGFLYTTNNNIFTTSSSDGSPAWSEAVVNLTAQPISKLRVGVQMRYELFGNYSNGITLDWAAADFKMNDHFGARFGKVKVPSGLLNETQDIDPSYMWSLLPQGVYPLPSRNGQLSTYGGVVYGAFALSRKLGKLEYRGWSGEDILASNDGFWLAYTEGGLILPNGSSGIATGGALHWMTPLTGLMIGASDNHKNAQVATATTGNGAYTGKYTLSVFNVPDYFARYEKNKVMVAVEAQREAGDYAFNFGGPPTAPAPFDLRSYYAMGSYKLTEKLTAGAYNSQQYSRASPLGPARYSKDWVVSGRYDFNQLLYAKVEQHFIDGTEEDYDADLNPGGIKPTTRLTVLKVGVSF